MTTHTSENRRATRRPPLTDVAGATVGAVVYGLLAATSVLPGVVLIGLLVISALTIPSAHGLAARVLRMVPILSALCFLTWMVPSPAMPHGDLIAAVIGGALGYWIARVVREGSQRRLLPRINIADLVAVPGVAALATANLSYMVFAPDSRAAFAYWSLQWDNSSHSFIDVAMRRNGVLIRHLPPAPDGTKYSFTEYPAGYHATAEAFMTYLLGHAPADVATELLAFVRITGFLGVVGAVVAASAVASLIAVRRNQLTASIGAGLAGSVMIAGPGSLGMVDAHYNFPFTLAMVMVVMSTVVSMPRVFNAWRFSLLVAAVTVAAGSWLPMGALAGLMVCAIALPIERRRWLGTRIGIITCLVVAAIGAAVCLVQVLWVVQAIPPSFADAPGGISRVLAHQFTLAVAFVLFGLGWAVWRGGRHGLRRGVRLRFGVVGAALLGLMVVYVVLALGQFYEFGQVRYYPAKLQNGFVVLASVYLAMAVALIGGWFPPRAGLQLTGRRLVAAAAGVIAMFTFGLPIQGPVAGDDIPHMPGTIRNQVKDRPGFASAIAESGRLAPDQYAIVALETDPGSVLRDSVLAASIRGTYSNGTSALLVDMLNTKASTSVGMAGPLREPMIKGKVVLFTTPDQEGAYRTALLGVPADAIRVIR